MAVPNSPPSSPVNAIPPIRTIAVGQPFNWLARGWEDFRRAGWISAFHGLILALIGAVIIVIAHQKFWFLAGALSGFMVVAPLLATSLYALSRAIERREKANFSVVLKTWLNWQDSHFNKWTPDYWCMVRFGILLMCAATGWVLTSAALITLLATHPIDSPLDFVQYVILAREGWLFEIWLALGGMLAAPLFASCVIAMPLLLDRRITVMQAILSSWAAVLTNPLTMAVWATLILALTLVAIGTFLLGMIVIIPVLGHASWHAYRDLVDSSDLPAREAMSGLDSQFGAL